MLSVVGECLYILGSKYHPGLYKIGTTLCLEDRLKQINSSFPEPIVYCVDSFRVINGRGIDKEREIHKMFLDKRIERSRYKGRNRVIYTEWFRLNEEDITVIKNKIDNEW